MVQLQNLKRQVVRKWRSTGIHLFTKVLSVSKPDIVAVGGWWGLLGEGPEGERRSWMEVNREIRHNLYSQRSLVMGARWTSLFRPSPNPCCTPYPMAWHITVPSCSMSAKCHPTLRRGWKAPESRANPTSWHSPYGTVLRSEGAARNVC